MTTETLGTGIALTRILIIDDHTTFAELLAGALDREPDLAGVGCAATAQAGVEQFLATAPDVVVLDYHLPDGDGLGVAEQILAMSTTTRVVMLTGDPTPGVLERAAALGVCAFLPKDGSLATMLETLRHARRGSMVVHPSLLAQLGARRAPSGGVPVPTLTQRELEVLRLMATGKDVRGNAKALGISLNTCRGYVKSILAKLGAHSQLEAVVTATHMGLLAGR
ncbi:response regulator transcription factor [Georgenia muralis]